MAGAVASCARLALGEISPIWLDELDVEEAFWVDDVRDFGSVSCVLRSLTSASGCFDSAERDAFA